MARLALLLGWFVVPAILLWLGHHLRSRSRIKRGAFWGGVIGYSITMIAALSALHFPPVLWSGGVRVFIAFWLMLLGGVLGAVIGALRGTRKPAF